MRHKLSKKYGNPLLKTIFSIPLLLIVSALAYFAFCEARKAYWDRQVGEMCKKEGGVQVYEKVMLDVKQYESIFTASGFILIPYKEMAKSNSEYFINNQIQYMRSARPEVWKMRTQVIRNSDKRVLGEKISYARVGGDFPTWAHDSSFGCANISSQKGSFLSEIFILKTERK